MAELGFHPAWVRETTLPTSRGGGRPRPRPPASTGPGTGDARGGSLLGGPVSDRRGRRRGVSRAKCTLPLTAKPQPHGKRPAGQLRQARPAQGLQAAQGQGLGRQGPGEARPSDRRPSPHPVRSLTLGKPVPLHVPLHVTPPGGTCLRPLPGRQHPPTAQGTGHRPNPHRELSLGRALSRAVTGGRGAVLPVSPPPALGPSSVSPTEGAGPQLVPGGSWGCARGAARLAEGDGPLPCVSGRRGCWSRQAASRGTRRLGLTTG